MPIMLQSAFAESHLIFRRTPLVSLRLASYLAAVLFVFAFAGSSFSQQPVGSTPTPTPTPAPTPIATNADGSQAYTAEQIVESSIILFGRGGGRIVLDQIRKTTFERGKVSVTNATGKTDTVPYQRWVIRGETQFKDRHRLEQDFPDARYSLVYNNEKVFGIFNDSSFTPREDAIRSFENQMFRGLDGLLRYKENGSTLTLGERKKILGVDYYVVDIKDKNQRTTRYYISVRSLKIMLLEYEEAGVKYERRFYDYRLAQGTMVPYRTVLTADGKITEETIIGTITYGQKVDEALFPES